MLEVVYGLAIDLAQRMNIIGLVFPAPYLKNQGLVKSAEYSLALSHAAGVSGSLLFSDIDLTEFRGSLATIPILPDPNTGLFKEIGVQVDEIIFEGEKYGPFDNFIIDSGS